MGFKKGQSGNPGGMQRDKLFGDALRISACEDANAKIPKCNGRNRLRAAADALMLKAMLGDVPAIKEVADRLDGKVPQAVIGGGEESAHVHQLIFRPVRPR